MFPKTPKEPPSTITASSPSAKPVAPRPMFTPRPAGTSPSPQPSIANRPMPSLTPATPRPIFTHRPTGTPASPATPAASPKPVTLFDSTRPLSTSTTTPTTTSASTEDIHHTLIENVHDISKVRRKGMDLAVELGFSRADATKVAVVISELARNILIYAKTGEVTISTNSVGQKYIKIVASDKGPGIPDMDQAMTDGWTTSKGLGLGLSGSKRLMDDFKIESEVGEGTTITAIKNLR